METATAIRTWKNGKATLTVTFPDGTTKTTSGKRAGEAVCVIAFFGGYHEKWLMQTRSNAEQAATEVHRDRTRTSITVRHGYARPKTIEVEPNLTVHMVMVTEA